MTAAEEAHEWYCRLRAEEGHRPLVDVLGPYFDSFCDACRGAYPDLSGEPLWEAALAWAGEMLAQAEATQNARGEIRALYLQQRLTGRDRLLPTQ